MGLSLSSPEVTDYEDASKDVTDYLVSRGLNVHTPAGCPLETMMEVMLTSGAVADACADQVRAGRSKDQRTPIADASTPPPTLLSALLLLDPNLKQHRFDCVPSMAHETVWWQTYLDCLWSAAEQRLPALCLQAEAVSSLMSFACEPPVGVGSLHVLKVSLPILSACRGLLLRSQLPRE